MAEGGPTLNRLQNTLQEKLGWNKYESAAYCALVLNGEMGVKDLELETGIPNSRIYGVLSKLEEEGRVKQKGFRPKTYEANRPKSVIETEVDSFKSKSDEAKARLEQAWEAERSYSPSPQGPWALISTKGLVNQMRSHLEDVEESVKIIDGNLKWVSKNDRLRLAELEEEGKSVQIIGREERELEYFDDEGLSPRSLESIERDFYVIDEKHVILRLDRGGAGVSFTDESIAKLFVEDFESKLTESEEVTSIAS